MHDRRDAEAGLLALPPLLGPQPGGALDGIDRPGAVDAGEVSDAVSGRILVPGRGRHLARHGATSSSPWSTQ